MEIEELRDRIRQWKARTQGAAVMDGEAAPAGDAYALPEGSDVDVEQPAEVPVEVEPVAAPVEEYAVEDQAPAESYADPEASPMPVEASPAPAEPAADDGGYVVVDDASAPGVAGRPDDTMDIDIDDGPSEALQAAEALGVDIQPPEGESTTEIDVPPDATDEEPQNQ